MTVRASEHDTASQLLGQLAEETSILVWSELELAAAERLPDLRRLALEAAGTVAALVASTFAFACLTWAAVRGADLILPGWAAPLVVAGWWLLVAVFLMVVWLPRSELGFAFRATPHEIARSARRARAESEEDLRDTAGRFIEAATRSAATRELKIATSAVERAVDSAQSDARYVVKELAAAMSAGRRASFDVLERMAGRKSSG